VASASVVAMTMWMLMMWWWCGWRWLSRGWIESVAMLMGLGSGTAMSAVV